MLSATNRPLQLYCWLDAGFTEVAMSLEVSGNTTKSYLLVRTGFSTKQTQLAPE
jgi:hypothetical protein